jgi:stearoyl-CoA desaturase (delta-9 desaturase)
MWIWDWGLSWIDVVLLVVLFVAFYAVGCVGVGVGLHRYLTHDSFKARRWLRITLAVMSGFALEGEPTQWVADHRRHHQFSDKEGDPHSPWRYGETVKGLVKGLIYSHVGWLFDRDMSSKDRFAPHLVADRDIQKVDTLFPWIVVASVALPPILVGLVTWSWQGAFLAFLWVTLVRIALLHHVTWSINSVCHVFGKRPFDSRDHAANFWPLALLSFGENWHNSHHADPTCARHGVQRGQIDVNARVIWLLERLGWVSNVRWPVTDLFQRKFIGSRKLRLGHDAR